MNDLIVVGSGGLADVQGILLWSVTTKVIQLAPIAVLGARGPPMPVEVKIPEPALRVAPAYWPKVTFAGGRSAPRVGPPGPNNRAGFGAKLQSSRPELINKNNPST